MPDISPRLKFAASALVLPLVALFAFLAAAPAAAAPSVPFVPCDTPSLVTAISTTVGAGGTQAITLSPGCIYTLTVVNNGGEVDTNGLPVISNSVDLTINGNGATILRDSAVPRFRIFFVAAGASLTLSNLTLTGGYTPDGTNASGGEGGSGGAIFNDGGAVTLVTSTLRGNRAGNGGNCCTGAEGGLGGFGGGAYNDKGTFIVVSSTIAGNIAGDGGDNPGGGGIGGSGGGLGGDGGHNFIFASTIVSNLTGSGSPSAGTLRVAGFGGGLAVYSSTLTVINSTLISNSTGNLTGLVPLSGVGGAILVNSGQLTVTNSTIASNTVGSEGATGGIATMTSSALIRNTILVANTAGNCGLSSLSNASTNNLADSDCGASFAQRTAAEINLGPLQNNGGPTLTMAPRFPSAALEAGDDASCPAADQTGQARPHGAHCDIGAIEFDNAVFRLFLPAVMSN